MKNQQTLSQAQLIFLIGEELKCTYLFNTLATIGFDYSYYRPDLTTLVLDALGLPGTSNDALDCYYHTLQKYSRPLKPNARSVARQARLAYRHLVRYQKK